MTEKYVDLHIHTNASDGTFSPSEVVKRAKSLGFSAIAITDHDTTKGIAEAMQKGKELDIEIVPGIELSAYYYNTEMHILGFYFSWEDGLLNQRLVQMREKRRNRAAKIVEKLRYIDIELNMDEIMQNASEDKAVGRLHIAAQLVKQGYCKDINDAFKKYIGKGCVGYVPKLKLTPAKAAELIKESGGIPIVAHPALSKIEHLLSRLIDVGMMGIEVFHSEHSLQDTESLLNFTQKQNLLITGGSDCHGYGKPEILIGKIRLPYHYLEKLKESVPQLV